MDFSFKRIAIVNRGEPAMRLIHAVKELNFEWGCDLKTVALYTEADARSLFVREADEAFCIGTPFFVDPSDGQRKSSYLDYARLEKCLSATKADAAWVGWGFVAEHPEFAELCQRLGVVFVGPTADVMRKLGDKIASKRIAEAAGVPVAPWSREPVLTLDEARAHAGMLGYPLMVKATAGGGGRGIRKVTCAEDLEEAYLSARSEALKGFGDDTVFMEKMVQGARHIEVQILADTHGSVWGLGVRDCSVQRRNQKVIEEAPSPALDSRLESEALEYAVQLSRKAGYVNAGTVEFLYDPKARTFAFMEMNTRLQVEHPVTELTTGVDIVKYQLRIASGHRLENAPPPTRGHAVEVRLNAEDPDNGFAPAPGKVTHFRLPTGPGIRIDTGLTEGDFIPSEFDSMIAKVIAVGKDRAEALARLRRALATGMVIIDGGASNKSFLLELLNHPDVIAGAVDIGWLDRYAAKRGEQAFLRPYADVAVAVAALQIFELERRVEQNAFFESASRGKLKLREEMGTKAELRYGSQNVDVMVQRIGPKNFRLTFTDGVCELELEAQNDLEGRVLLGNKSYRYTALVQGADLLIEINGVPHRISRGNAGTVRASSAAIVLGVFVKVGDVVAAGTRLVSLEAMKMETSVLAPCGGRVREILVSKNLQVTAGHPLVILEPEQSQAATEPQERVALPAFSSTKSTLRYSEALSGLRHFLLGYDADIGRIGQVLSEPHLESESAAEDLSALLRQEQDVMDLFVDCVSLHKISSDMNGTAGAGSEEHMMEYLRSLKSGQDVLPVEMAGRLQNLLRWYGVESLTDSSLLEDALVLLHKAQKRLPLATTAFLGVLRRRMESELWARGASQAVQHVFNQTEAVFGNLLERLILATHQRFLAVNDMARHALYKCFEQPRFAEIQTRVLQNMDSLLQSLLAEPEHPAKNVQIDALVYCAQSLVGFLIQKLSVCTYAREKSLLTEILLRHIYRTRSFESFSFVDVPGFQGVRADYVLRDKTLKVVGTFVPFARLAECLAGMASYAEQEKHDEILCDVFAVVHEVGESPETLRGEILAVVNALPFPASVKRICVALRSADQHHGVYHFTFRPQADGSFGEDVLLRGIHPMEAKRFELWRFRDFDLRRLPASGEDVFLFRAVANSNPKDVRLIAFAEVRDLSLSFDESGAVTGMPHFERVFSEAASSLRDYLSRLPSRERPRWNRIVIHVEPPAANAQREIFRLLRKLLPLSEHLELEKVVIRAQIQPKKTEELADYVIDISGRGRTGLRVALERPSGGAIRTLTKYELKVMQAQQKNLFYPYEIVRALATSEREMQGLPQGEFVEYELTQDNVLEAVIRPYGENRANVVVGVIKNFTEKFPEGMERVIILGDPTMEMGALAEPECRRIQAALDLATALRLPVEWFAVSSGAKIAMDSGTENLDWTARTLRRIIEFTQAGGEINVVVDGVNVGAQSYWNAEATMLTHTRGVLIMTPEGAMVLTGKRALDYSGSVSAEDNQGIGGADRIMGPNGQAQYYARDLGDACRLLLRYYEHTYVAPGEKFPRKALSRDPRTRNVCLSPHPTQGGGGFAFVGDIFSDTQNPGRKKPFDMRAVMRATVDQDLTPLERWSRLRGGESAVVWDAHIGGHPVCVIGIESKPVPRLGPVPGDGPETWMAGTLFPLSSKKIARAINAASGNRPVVVLANLSGFDGSPESMRNLQLEFGAELGRAVVNCKTPLVLCVLTRFHGGAYVVFSQALNPNVRVMALEGSYASVIGGTPAAAVVFPGDVKARTLADPRIVGLQEEIVAASETEKARLRAHLNELYKDVYLQKQAEIAEAFDAIHSVHRAQKVGSVHDIVAPAHMRAALIDAIERGLSAARG